MIVGSVDRRGPRGAGGSENNNKMSMHLFEILEDVVKAF